MFNLKVGDIIKVIDTDKKCKMMTVMKVIDKGSHVEYIFDTDPE